MNASRLKTALLGTGAAVVMMAAASPAFADDVSDLRKQINIMQEKIAKLEADKSLKKRRVAAAAAVEAGDKPRSWKLPGTNTSMSVGGYAKLDIFWDLGTQGGLTTGAGATRNGNNAGNNTLNGGSWTMHARQSRIFVRTWTPTDWGELATHIEGDFYGSGNSTFRLRHAYGRLGPVLAGQTWSTWMPVFAGAEILDFAGPSSAIFARVAQVRYTHSFGGGFFMDLALESQLAPGSINSAGAPVTTGTVKWPDLVVTAYYNMPKGRLWLGGILRRIETDTGTGVGADSTLGWGIAVAGAFKVSKKVRFGFQGVIGKGVQSFMTGTSAVLNPTANGQGDLDAVMAYGGYVWGQYRWTDTIRSSVVWSYYKNALNDALTGVNANSAAAFNGQAESIHQAFVNLIWSPVPQVNIGIEYSWNQTNFYAGANYTGNRIQVSFQYSF